MVLFYKASSNIFKLLLSVIYFGMNFHSLVTTWDNFHAIDANTTVKGQAHARVCENCFKMSGRTMGTNIGKLKAFTISIYYNTFVVFFTLFVSLRKNMLLQWGCLFCVRPRFCWCVEEFCEKFRACNVQRFEHSIGNEQ